MRVLVTDPIAESGLAILRERVPVDVKAKLSEDQLVEVIGDYDALVVRSGTQVTARVIAAAAKLQIIGRAGVGVDNIDVEAATQRGIMVVNAPDGNSIAAAEHTIAMMMSMTRHIPRADASLRDGRWERRQFMGTEVTGKTLGVIGMGRIGREVAHRARGLQMRVLAYDPYVSSEQAERLGVEMCELEDVLCGADFITVHVPLTEATRNLIGKCELEMIKPTAYLINCARGGIVDEAALHAALQDGQLAGAALDVFISEPPLDSPLLDNPKVVITPHLGASTREAQVAVSVDVARQVLGGLQDALRLEQHLDCGLVSDYAIFPEKGFAVLRAAEVPAVLTESSFHSNPEEERRLRDPVYNRREAYGLFLGLARWAQGGLPAVRLIQPEDGRVRVGEAIVIGLDDGLSSRGGFGLKLQQIRGNSLRVEWDGKPLSCSMDLGRAQIRVTPTREMVRRGVRLRVDFANTVGHHVLHPWVELNPGG